MTSYPDLTIATTIHNNLERWLEMATSFEREAGFPVEIVAVDDGSAEPARITGLRSPVRLLRNDRPRGFAMASDQALREVRTPFALLVDADITFLPGDFQAAFAAFKAQPKLAWSNFRQLSIGGAETSSGDPLMAPPFLHALGNQAVALWKNWKLPRRKPQMLTDQIEAVPVAYSSSALVRMQAFHEINGFDPRFWQSHSDNDLCLRLGEAGWDVGINRSYTVQHDALGGEAGGVRRVLDLYRAQLLFYELHWPSSRLYLRPLLALRHLAEVAVMVLLRPAKNKEHHRPGLRLKLAGAALRGYPREKT
jgi:GT2 family glycosyltransferase